MESERSFFSFLLMFAPFAWIYLLFSNRNGKVVPLNSGSPRNLDHKIPFQDHSSACLLKDLNAIWERPMEKLPVHVDIPRLAKRMELKVNGERRKTNLIPDFEDDSVSIDYSIPRMYSLFSSLSFLLEGEEMQKKVETMFYFTFSPLSPALVQFVKEGKIDNDVLEPNYDVARTLSGFLKRFGEDTKLVKILKCTNQSFLSAGVLRLKYLIGGADVKDLYSTEGLNYKDVKGGWKILINFDDDKITITHQRWEQSFLPDSFKFVWEMSATFDSSMETMQSAKINIPQVKFGIVDTPERQQLFNEAAKIYMQNPATS